LGKIFYFLFFILIQLGEKKKIIYYQKTHLIYISIISGSILGIFLGGFIAIKIYNKIEKKNKKD